MLLTLEEVKFKLSTEKLRKLRKNLC